MMNDAEPTLASSDREIRAIAGRNWVFRWDVEREAGQRFASFAQRFTAIGAPEVLRDLALRAAGDETRHTTLCAELAAHLGQPTDPSRPIPVAEIAPARLEGTDRLTYEVVAACCIAETESMGTLTTLLSGEMEPRVREVVHAIATDEVGHARLGWAYLSWLGSQRDLAFVGPLIPPMLTPGRDLFRPPADPLLESPELLRWGVLPHAHKRAVYVAMLNDVIFPGLRHARVDPAAGQAWLERRQREMEAMG